ncbi:MAG: hypothetical protein WBP26_02705 [Candidatus Saccharimonadales bacterium]
MQRLKDIIHRGLLCMLALVLLGSYPATVSAQTVVPAEASSVQSEAPVAPEPPVPPKRTYTYDPETGRWNSEDWTYDAGSGSYVPTPKPIHVEPTPKTTDAPSPEVSATATTDLDASSTAAIDNTVQSKAQSGNASVTGNTTAGNATTGSAQAVATIFNNVLSSISGSNNPQVATFVTDIVGDVYGDIMLYPTMIKGVLSAVNPMSGSTAAQATVQNSTAIENNVNLQAASGNAVVTGNTTAGNATSGNAVAMANIINMINSIIAANKSFAGTINIYGNLDGDILVSPDFIPQLLASNGGSLPDSLRVNSTDNQSIINNVNLHAASGDASVAHNTTAGNATTGSADTNLVILNMTGHEVVASNSLLVFVNVLGSWVGLIVDAPAGSTAAAYGNGVLSNSVKNLDIDATNNAGIVNNINLNAQSGDALVANNTTAGSATSGNASAVANIVNINGTTFNLSDWFGLLFINVFGSWHGSFGVDTPNGNAPAAPVVADVPATTVPVLAMQFIPTTAAVMRASAATNDTSGSGNVVPPVVAGYTHANHKEDNQSKSHGVVAAASTTTPSSGMTAGAGSLGMALLSAILVVTGLTLAFGRQFYGVIVGRGRESLAEPGR